MQLPNQFARVYARVCMYVCVSICTAMGYVSFQRLANCMNNFKCVSIFMLNNSECDEYDIRHGPSARHINARYWLRGGWSPSLTYCTLTHICLMLLCMHACRCMQNIGLTMGRRDIDDFKTYNVTIFRKGW